MDKETLSNYGWIVICILVLSVMIALATPFGQFIESGVWSVTEGLFDTQENAFDIIFDESDIQIKSSDELYALGRIFQQDSIKSKYINKDTYYNIQQDLDMFAYPEEIITNADKIAYLQTASYELENNLELSFAKVEGKNYFTGIGSSNSPFMGVLNGNGKTITFKATGTFDFSDVPDYGTGLFDTTENAKIFNLNIDVVNDIALTSISGGADIGMVIGNATNTQMENCTVTITNSVVGTNLSNSTTTPIHIGGIVGFSSLSTYKNCNVILNNSTLKGCGTTVTPTRNYGGISIGGIIGFSSAGSSNDDNIGALGNQVYNCSFVSKNNSQQDIILATIEIGNELSVGGIVGCTFNNLIIKDCNVNVQKGNISAIKTGATDSASYGTQVGGIIGRMEHTTEVSNCSVTGDYLNILSKSPNNVTTAGGIAGVDMGAYHRDIDTINNSHFDGSGTSNIKLEITSSDTLERNRIIGAGGIVGVGSYIMSNCSVKDVTVTNNSANIGNPTTYVGEMAGLFIISKPAEGDEIYNAKGVGVNWTYKKYFKPRTSGIYNCTAENITIIKSDNVKNMAYASK